MILQKIITYFKEKAASESQQIRPADIRNEKLPDKRRFSGYPRPSLRREEWYSLDGYWHYAVTEDGGRPEVFEGKTAVPETGLNHKTPGSYLWYFHSLEITEVPETKKLLLHFGMIQGKFMVWWNGKLLGSGQGGKISFDVTSHLKEGKNTIWVRIHNEGESVTADLRKKRNSLLPVRKKRLGIRKDVWLEWVPQNYITHIKYTPLPEMGMIKVELSMITPCNAVIRMEGECNTYEHRVYQTQFEWRDVFSPNGAGGRQAVAVFILDLPEIHKEAGEDSFIYKVEVQTEEDQARSSFTMRKKI